MSRLRGPGTIEYGVYGRVLFCGQLEKRRDGVVRGGWATRLFVLTPDTLHYYRKGTEYELLGEERGHVRSTSVMLGHWLCCLLWIVVVLSYCRLHSLRSQEYARCQKMKYRMAR